MQKIIPFLWFDSQAEEAANFYVSVFKNSEIGETFHYDKASAEVSGQPEGSVLTVGFTLDGFELSTLNGGPMFKFSPAVSFFANYTDEKYLDTLWENLVEGGKILMEYTKYPFSEKYGWLEDKYGVSWQLSLADSKQKITPSLLFVGDQYGKATEAMNMYVALFENSGIEISVPYEKGEEKNGKEGAIKFAKFSLNGQDFIAMDSGMDHKFTFTEAISFLINCETQEEIDKFWDALADGGEIQQCGWVKDRYGVTWQVVPSKLNEMLSNPKVMQTMLQMKKLVIADLEAAAK